MSELELLDRAQWRSFRMFLLELDNAEFRRVYLQVQRELAARRERDSNITRLFFSSLTTSDLEKAQLTIRAERCARAQDRKTLACSAASKKTTSRACR